MGILVLLVSEYLFNKRIENEKKQDRIMIWGAVLLYFVFSLFLNWYLREVYGWAHGIPGSDLQQYFEGAQALKEGARLSELVRISSSFEVSIAHIGYLAYIVFIAVIAMTPVIFNLEISLQIIYCVQAFAAIAAALNIADFFNDYEDTRVRNRILWILLLCASILQASAILMRDIWILFFISCLLRECKKTDCSLVKCIFFIALSFVFRYYTLAITLPILLGYKFNKKKTATIALLGVFVAFFVGQELINTIARMVGIGWMFDFHFDLYSMASYIMFPSPISQAYNVQHLNTGFHAIFGGNTEWIYYLLSCWNVFVFPVSAYGIYRSVRDHELEDAALWGMIIVNIAMLMCLFYDAVSSPRHKLLIVFGIAYFYKKGSEAMSQIMRVAFFFMVLFGLIVLFALVG